MTTHFIQRMSERFGVDLTPDDVRHIKGRIVTGDALLRCHDRGAAKYVMTIKGVAVLVVVNRYGELVTAMEPRTHNRSYSGRKQKSRAPKHLRGKPVQRRRGERWA